MTTDAKWSDFASMDGSRTLAAASRLLPPWITLALVVIIAWQVAKIFWMLVPGPAAGDPVTPPANVPAANSSGDTGADVQAIVAAHIFGVADPEEQAVPVQQVPDEDYADTRKTNLQLKGTIAATDSESAVAIIADGNNEEKIYLIGDTIMSGVSLHAVYAERVVLNENGALTNLRLPKEFPATTTSAVRRNSMMTARPAASNAGAQSIQQVVAQNVSKLADIIRPVPYFQDNQQQGYRVYPGRDRQQFAKLGLRPGDLIKDIDGQSLNDPTQAMQIFQSLDNAEQVSVTVERNGEQQVIVLSTSQLELEDDTNQ